MFALRCRTWARMHVYAALGVQAAPCGCRSEFTTAIWGAASPESL